MNFFIPCPATFKGTNSYMKKEVQLSLDSFDATSPLRCKAAPGQNAYKMNCCPCVHAIYRGPRIFCTRFRRPVSNGQKYSLKEWKSIRGMVLDRDCHRCVICDTGEGLHIHHIDRDPTNDDLPNLVTLCAFCHARAHAELHRDGGTARVLMVIDYYRRSRNQVFRGEPVR